MFFLYRIGGGRLTTVYCTILGLIVITVNIIVLRKVVNLEKRLKPDKYKMTTLNCSIEIDSKQANETLTDIEEQLDRINEKSQVLEKISNSN